eukprot:7560029-Pyramimonas_sp.AAC.1
MLPRGSWEASHEAPTSRQESGGLMGACLMMPHSGSAEGAVWRCGGMEVWRHGGMEVLRHGGMEAWRYGGME